MQIKGLENKEFETYKHLLTLKRATVLELSRISGEKRSNLYRHLEELVSKGIVSEVFEGKKHYYIAESPKRLLGFVDDQKTNIEALLPELEQIEKEAFEYIHKIDQMGGMLAAVEVGFPQREISEAAYEFQKRMEQNNYTMVGVNQYADDQGDTLPIMQIDLAVEGEQLKRLNSFKKGRNQERCQEALNRLRTACKEGTNVMPVLIDAVDDGVTLGEACDIYREVFGVYTDPGFI